MRVTLREAFPTFGDEEWCDVPTCLNEMPAFSEICSELKERTTLMNEGTYTRKYPERISPCDPNKIYSSNACPDKKYRDVFAIRREGKTILYGTPAGKDSLDRIGEIDSPNHRQDTRPAYPSGMALPPRGDLNRKE